MNRAAVSSYADDTPRKVPGLADIHRMAIVLLTETIAGAGDILVVGAGGGLEVRAMADARPDWRFVGVDPSVAMLDLARAAVEPVADRVELIEGTVDQAPERVFDGATCLLTLHFLDRTERVRTLREIRRRMKPGAALVVAHHAPPGPEPERWMARSAMFGARGVADPVEAAATGRMMTERLPLLPPEDEEAVLREAGFGDVALFYAALSFRGWAATAP